MANPIVIFVVLVALFLAVGTTWSAVSQHPRGADGQALARGGQHPAMEIASRRWPWMLMNANSHPNTQVASCAMVPGDHV
jgi:hypothetical protein